ncbi:MAG TPA: T9SS type A sorting domain-containing protein [Flavobacterium sp.]|jgi:uncharacterized delta-60 repeat protein
MELQNDGKIVVVATSGVSSSANIVLQRYDEDGLLDESFGSDGTAAMPAELTGSTASSVRIKADGKIVICGSTTVGGQKDIIAMQFTSSGFLDNAFNLNGYRITSIGSLNDVATTMALQPDGKIVVAGTEDVPNMENGICMVRYNNDGALDSTFATNGVYSELAGLNFVAKSLVVSDSGMIYLGVDSENNFGTMILAFNSSGFGVSFPIGIEDSDLADIKKCAFMYQTQNEIHIGGNFFSAKMAIVSINLNGTNQGRFQANIEVGHARGMNVSRLADGSYLSSGYAYHGRYDGLVLGVKKYSANGTVNFSQTITSVRLSEAEASHTLQTDGKIIVAGGNIAGRLNPDGSLDGTFGNNGSINYFGTASDIHFHEVGVQSNNKILLFGHSAVATGAYGLTIARLTSNGFLDTTFGVSGYVKIDIPNSLSEFLNAFVILPDDSIIAGGYYLSDNEFKPCIIKYTANGQPDTGFGNAGIVLSEMAGYPIKLHVSNSGKIIVTGVSPSFIAQFNSDGTPDTMFGANGVVTSTLFSFESSGLTNSGKILVAGKKIMQYDALGNIDNNFGTDGIIELDDLPGFYGIEDIKVQPDNKIIAIGGTQEFYLFRFLSDTNLGVLDFEQSRYPAYIYPNPVEIETTFVYKLAEETTISISLFDMSGKLIKRYKDSEIQSAGEYNQVISLPETLQKGAYILSFSSPGGNNSIKLFKN